MATYSSVLAWKIPWIEQPGGLHSKESQRVGHNWATMYKLIIPEGSFFYLIIPFKYNFGFVSVTKSPQVILEDIKKIFLFIYSIIL